MIDPEHFEPPETAEALGRLSMPMADAMGTQRAVRRLHTDPVPHELLLPLLELSLKAPTSSNTQDWSYLVVEDPQQKARLAGLYRKLYRVFNPIVERLARGDITWTPETVADLFVRGPDVVTPGTKMPIQTVGNAEDLAALIRFLEAATR